MYKPNGIMVLAMLGLVL